AGVGGLRQSDKILDRSEVGMNGTEVGDVVAVVLEGGSVDGHQPEAIYPELAEVIKFLDQSAQVAVAVAVTVKKATDIHFVKDGVLFQGPVPARHPPPPAHESS